MNSPFGAPSEPRPPPLQRNYADVFKPEDYECKDSVELESYARNLRNYMLQLLQQQPFPQFLFDKLEKRLDGITTILLKRSVANHVLDKKGAQERLNALDRRLQTIQPILSASTSPQGMLDVNPAPLKKRKQSEPEHVQEVRRELNSLRQLKKSYSDSQSTQPVDEENEEEED